MKIACYVRYCCLGEGTSHLEKKPVAAEKKSMMAGNA